MCKHKREKLTEFVLSLGSVSVNRFDIVTYDKEFTETRLELS